MTKDRFALSKTYQPFYKPDCPITLTADGYLVAFDGENVNYVNRSSLEVVRTLNNDKDEVTWFVANPNDYTVVIATKDRMLKQIDRFHDYKRAKIWNSHHPHEIFAMDLNKDSTRLATGSSDGQLRIWHIGENEGCNFPCYYHKSKISIVKFHKTEKFVVSVAITEPIIALWNTENGKQMGLFDGHVNTVTDIDFVVDSDTMVTSSKDQTIRIWSVKSPKQSHIIIPMTIDSLDCITILHNSLHQTEHDTFMILSAGESGHMSLISPYKKSIVRNFTRKNLFLSKESAEFDSKWNIRRITDLQTIGDELMVVRTSAAIEFYNNTDIKFRHQLPGELANIKYVTTVGSSKKHILMLESAPYLRVFAMDNCLQKSTKTTVKPNVWPCEIFLGYHTNEITAVCVCANGEMVVSGCKNGTVSVWRVTEQNDELSLSVVAAFEHPNENISFVSATSTGKQIFVYLSVQNTLTILNFDGNNLKPVYSYPAAHKDIVLSMDVTVDESMLATASKDKSARIWAVKEKKLEHIGVLAGHKKQITSVKFSSKEKIVVTAGNDCRIMVWSLATFSCMQIIQTVAVPTQAMFWKDTNFVVNCDVSGVINVWDEHGVRTDIISDTDDDPLRTLTPINDPTTGVYGFVVAGDWSALRCYRDATEENRLLSNQEKIATVEGQQELDNLMFQENFGRALSKAIELNLPEAAFKALSKLARLTPFIRMSPVEMSQRTPLGMAVRTLSEANLRRLYGMASRWQKRHGCQGVASQVLPVIYCIVPYEELASWPEVAQSVDYGKIVSMRQWNRLDKCQESVAFLDNLLMLMERKMLKKPEEMDTSG